MPEIIKYAVFVIVLLFKVKCNYGFVDYRDVLKTKCFVDKSMLIKELVDVEDTAVKVITVPRHFGKSTNVDMIRRFFEINVNKKGELLNMETTPNQKMFCSNKLKICEERRFFKENFGSRPVLYIDFLPLQGSSDYQTTLEAFKKVLKETYKRHSYLMRAKYLWNKQYKVDDFRNVITERHENSTQDKIEHGFEYLSKLLGKHFRKKVYVLIDEYDLFAHNVIYRQTHDSKQIISLISKSLQHLLISNSDVQDALLTGVLDVIGEELINLGDNVRYYEFLGNHTFSEYFGLTGTEVSKLIKHISTNKDENRIFNEVVNTNYAGNINLYKNHTLFNYALILKYLSVRQNGILWIGFEYILNYATTLTIGPIFKQLIRLIQGESMILDVSRRLSETDLLFLHKIHNTSLHNVLYEKTFSVYYYFLYKMGYLIAEHHYSNTNFSVRIPTLEKEERISEGLFEFINVTYDTVTEEPPKLSKYFNKISQHRVKRKMFVDIVRHLQNLLRYCVVELKTKESIRNFIHLIFRYQFTRTYMHTKMPELDEMEILTENKNGVPFLMKITMTNSTREKDRARIARATVRQMVSDNRIKVDPKRRKHFVLFGMSFCPKEAMLTVSYAKLLKESDSLNRTKTLSFHPRDIYNEGSGSIVF